MDSEINKEMKKRLIALLIDRDGEFCSMRMDKISAESMATHLIKSGVILPEFKKGDTVYAKGVFTEFYKYKIKGTTPELVYLCEDDNMDLRVHGTRLFATKAKFKLSNAENDLKCPK